MQNQQANVKFSTNVFIEDLNTGEVLVNECNAIHSQNLARVIARGLANEASGNIHQIHLGNGGTYVDTTGVIRFNTPNTVGSAAQLYNKTYSEVVDGTIVNGNSTTSSASTTDVTSIVTVELTLAANEPSGQWLTDADGVNTPENPATGGYVYEFDELGCFAKNPLYDALNPTVQPEYLLLTHIIFQPIAKTQNRELRLTYSLTISVS